MPHAAAPTSTAIAEPQQPVALPAPSTEPGPGAAIPRHRRRLLLAAFVVLGGAAAAVAIVRAWPALFPPATTQVIQVSGRIEGREVTLAAKTIQGRVKRVLADEGQRVTQGQLLAELEAGQVEAQVAAARASVATLDAQVRQASLDVAYAAKNSDAAIAAAEAALSSVQAYVVRAHAVEANTTAAYGRARALFDFAALSRQELDAAEMAQRTSHAETAAAEKEVARAEANLALARASRDTIGLKRQQLRVLQEGRRSAAARLDEAEANLAESRVIAPQGGTIVSRPVEVGDVVGPGTPIFQLVDMSRLYVKVYIPEPRIASLRLGDPAEIAVDAFPDHRFTARISRIADQAEFTPKNVETAEERLKLVFGVELALDNPEGLLKPGMPADAVIHPASPRAAGPTHES